MTLMTVSKVESALIMTLARLDSCSGSPLINNDHGVQLRFPLVHFTFALVSSSPKAVCYYLYTRFSRSTKLLHVTVLV